MRITKSELAELMDSKNPNISSTKDFIDVFLEALVDTLKEGNSISFNNFGTFTLKEKESKEKDSEETKIKKSINFKIAKKLTDELNQD